MAHSSVPLRADMATGKVLAHKCKWGIGGEHESDSKLRFVFEFMGWMRHSICFAQVDLQRVVGLVRKVF